MSREPEVGGPGERRRARPGGLVPLVCTTVAALWLILDQATKVLAVQTLEAGGRVVDLGVVDLRVIRNPGGAFGFPGFPGLFVIVTVLVLVLVVRALPSTDRLSLAVAYGLVTGGALGNVADRLLRVPGFPSGHVVDFFDLRWWPVFNIADVGIVTGALSIAVLLTVADREARASQRRQAARRCVRPDTTTPRS